MPSTSGDQREQFERWLEAVPDATICVWEDGTIGVVNAEAERMFGYGHGELIGESIEILVPGHARQMHAGQRARYLADPRPRPRPMQVGLQFAARRGDASVFPAEISLNTVEIDERVLVLAVVRDVTERLEMLAEQERIRADAERARMETQLHQSQRLESLGQLASGIAHDFNNLLSVIINYSTFAGRSIAHAPPGAGGEYWTSVATDVHQVVRAAERGAELTRQLLAFARREPVHVRVLDVNAIVEDVEPLLRRTLERNIEFETDLAANVAPVSADPGQIEQVLVNLVVNARDAMPSGGRLTIDTRDVAVTLEDVDKGSGCEPGAYTRLRVTDTGAGISEDVLPRVFEPFFSTKTRGNGSGLGLATVHGIVARAGGYVDVSSRQGRGTTFSVFLPATDESLVPAGPTHTDTNIGR